MRPSTRGRTVGAMALEHERTFFVESYIPQLDAHAASALSSRLQRAVAQLSAEGLPLAWIRSFALLEEETYVWMVAAGRREHVVLVQRRAGVALDHIVEAAPGEAPGP
jgi:hypothetical protein